MKAMHENFMGSMTRDGINMSDGLDRKISKNAGNEQSEYSYAAKAPKIDADGFFYKFCKTMRPEQQKIVGALKSKRDVFINMGAGGGKTQPIFCYWLNDILGLNVIMDQKTPGIKAEAEWTILQLIKLRNIEWPKLLFLVPTRALADQSVRDFQDAIKDLMIQYFIKIINNYYNTDHKGKQQSIKSNKYDLDYNNRQHMNHLETFLNEISSINNTLNQLCKNFRFNVRKFYGNYNNEQFKDFIKPQFFDQLKLHIIEHVDRTAHNLICKRDGEGTVGGRPENALVTVAIYQSAPGVIETLIKNNLKLIVCDEAHQLQNSTADLKDIKEKTANQIATGLYKTLNNIKGKKVQLVFLTGTIHPNAVSNITTYLQKCYDRNFINLKPFRSKNTTPINSVVDQKLSNPSSWVPLLQRHISQNDYGIGFILYSKKLIRQLCEKLLAKTGTFNKSGQINREFKRTQIIHTQDLKTDLTGIGKQIEDKFLRQCVANGFAFFDGSINNNDKSIVSKLFMDKQIAVVIATDGLGVGMNLAIQTLYLPTNKKWSSTANQMDTVPHRDLVQLVNRVGRGKYPVGYIHTTKEDLTLIDQAIIANPDTFPDVKAIEHFKCGSILGAKYFNSLFFTITSWYNIYKDLDKRF